MVTRSAWMVLRLVVLVGLSGILLACSHPPVAAPVRAAIDQSVVAARSTDAGKLSDVVSDGFDGKNGLLDKRALVNMLRVERLRGQSIKVLLGPVSIERRGQRFVATFTVTLSGGRGWVPRHPGVFRVSSGWRNEGGDWRCYSATWKRVLRCPGVRTPSMVSSWASTGSGSRRHCRR